MTEETEAQNQQEGTDADNPPAKPPASGNAPDGFSRPDDVVRVPGIEPGMERIINPAGPQETRDVPAINPPNNE